MQRRKVNKKKRHNSRARQRAPRGSKLPMETEEQHSGTEASKLFGSRFPRSYTTLRFFEKDLSDADLATLLREDSLAIDTETGGLDFRSCKLFLITIGTKDGRIFLVKNPEVSALNLKKLFNSPHITFIFHHAAFDLKFIVPHIGCSIPKRFECTKTLSKIIEPDKRSGLGSVISRLCSVDLPKDIKHEWHKTILSKDQVDYAVNDVLYLHEILNKFRALSCNTSYLEFYYDAIECIRLMSLLEIAGYANALVYQDEDIQTLTEKRAWWLETEGQLGHYQLLKTMEEFSKTLDEKGFERGDLDERI